MRPCCPRGRAPPECPLAVSRIGLSNRHRERSWSSFLHELAWVNLFERKRNPRTIPQYDLAILFPAEAIVTMEIQVGGFCAEEEVKGKKSLDSRVIMTLKRRKIKTSVTRGFARRR